MRFGPTPAVVLALCAAAPAATAQDLITNPSFEHGWSGWQDVDPDKDATSISGHARTGEKSAKISKATGRFEQQITLAPGSDYMLRAAVKGPGSIGITLGAQDFTAASGSETEDWITLEVPFSSGDATEATIFGSHNGSEGRFDDFEITALSGPALDAAEQAAAGPVTYATIPGACERMSQLGVSSARDDGTHDGHGPELTIDGSFQPESRWSSKLEGKELVIDMGMPQTLKEIGIAFYKGNERQNFFALETSVNGTDFTPLMGRTASSGTTTAIERFDFDDRVARHIKLIGLGNASNEWNSVLEIQPWGCGMGEIAPTGDGSDAAEVAGISAYGLATGKPPAANFDLTNWKITLPVDEDGDGRADEISETLLANGWSDERYFYTDPVTGGMVFRVVGTGATTQNSSYSRAELREMLRGGDESIATRNEDGTPTANNWVLSSAPPEAQAAAGGVDGTMTATLAVNQVTRMGEGSRVGRVIIGQIHAKDGEPIRLYYRKLPTNKYGSVYYIHEREGRDDIYVPLIGDRSDFAENPADGIALDERFSYEIRVSGKEVDGTVHPILDVSITRDDGTTVSAPPLDMSDSDYSIAEEFMYFKAGAYSQNNSSPWPERDFDQVTFFALEARH
ncbi:polysaccharide lyase family 7 protein [Vannielia litorea]|uniref:Poly(Beta-D-mannuronate) lyase n=1 Tax=Vannielia litorea TaxID=1217970 RepID=A0A1N6ECI3_9RHOB|nr:polysaccharide lyase family 7 protein [Vannielia litorea]SIN80703.1 poly(beta-D-mannuronate) lyase [Vannielia litorea]